MPVIGTVCPGTHDNTCFVFTKPVFTGIRVRFTGSADKTHPNAGALFCRNAPALSVRAHLKLCILVHAERRQPIIWTVCPGGKEPQHSHIANYGEMCAICKVWSFFF